MTAADFYTGLVADLYGPLKAHRFDAAPYSRFVRSRGEPALELGCGDGEPLLDLVAAGLDVDGVDSSADMLERCRDQAARRGLQVSLFAQRMEDLDLPRRYRSIFLAGPTLTLLPDDATAGRALAAIRRHLLPDGRALVPVTVPAVADPGLIGTTKQVTGEDGAVLRVTWRDVVRDEETRTQVTSLRYEREQDGRIEQLDREWVLHWYPPDVRARLVHDAGLVIDAAIDEDGLPLDLDADDMMLVLAPA